MSSVAVLQEYKHKQLQKWLSNNGKAFLKDMDWTYVFLTSRFKSEMFSGVKLEVVKKISENESHILHFLKISKIEPMSEAFKEVVESEIALNFMDVAAADINAIYEVETVDHLRVCIDRQYKLYLYQNFYTKPKAGL
jgi:hypothetical protein